MGKPDTVSDPSGWDGRRGLRRRLMVALLFALPSIGSWLSTNVVYLRLDELQQPVARKQTEIMTAWGSGQDRILACQHMREQKFQIGPDQLFCERRIGAQHILQLKLGQLPKSLDVIAANGGFQLRKQHPYLVDKRLIEL